MRGPKSLCGMITLKQFRASFMTMVLLVPAPVCISVCFVYICLHACVNTHFWIFFFLVKTHFWIFVPLLLDKRVSCFWSANKFWSGLLEDYYLPRASRFFSYLTKSLRENEKFKLEEWRKEWISYSNKWQSETQIYAVKAKGDALEIAKTLFKNYFG